MRTQLPFPKKGTQPQFLAHVYCAQMAGWIKMPLGMEVGLNPSDIVLHGDPAPPPESGTDPHYSAMSIVAKWSPISATVEHLFKCDVDHDIPLQIVWTGSGSVPDGCGRPKVISACLGQNYSCMMACDHMVWIRTWTGKDSV